MSSTRKVLTAEEFFVAGKLRREWVPIPEWPSQNGDEAGVYVTELSALERSKWEELALDATGNTLPEITLLQSLVHGIVDESGKRIFTADQFEEIGRHSSLIAWRIYKAFVALNRLNAMVEESKKN